MTDKTRFTSVWDAIEDTPQEAASMKARSALMLALSAAIQERGLSQAQAAEIFGVTQPRISDLVRGKINLFSLDTLMDMAATAGMAPMVKVTKLKVPALKRLTQRRLAAA
jgi:predicted XRE-type DNA-binding protein